MPQPGKAPGEGRGTAWPRTGAGEGVGAGAGAGDGRVAAWTGSGEGVAVMQPGGINFLRKNCLINNKVFKLFSYIWHIDLKFKGFLKVQMLGSFHKQIMLLSLGFFQNWWKRGGSRAPEKKVVFNLISGLSVKTQDF